MLISVSSGADSGGEDVDAEKRARGGGKWHESCPASQPASQPNGCIRFPDGRPAQLEPRAADAAMGGAESRPQERDARSPSRRTRALGSSRRRPAGPASPYCFTAPAVRFGRAAACLLALAPIFAGAPAEAQDITPPMFESATVDGATLEITFDEALSTSHAAPGQRFGIVNPDDSTVHSHGTSSAVSINGKTATVTLETAAVAGRTYTVGYSRPGAVRLQDAVGNEVATFRGKPVRNLTGFARLSVSSAQVSGDGRLTLTFSGDLDPWSRPAGAAFEILQNDRTVATGTGAASIAGGTVNVDLEADSSYAAGSAATVKYTRPDPEGAGSHPGAHGRSLPLQAAASGLDVADFTEAVTVPGDFAGPRFQSASVNGRFLTLRFTESLKIGGVGVPLTFAYDIRADGVRRSLLSGTPTDYWEEDNNRAITLQLRSNHEVRAGQTVTVSYAAPPLEGCIDIRFHSCPLRGVSDALVSSFTNEPVDNVTPDSTGPRFERAEIDGATLTVTFDEPLDDTVSVQANAVRVQVGEGGVFRSATSVSIDGATVTATISLTPPLHGEDVNWRYFEPDDPGRRIRDPYGNELADPTGGTVTNNTPPAVSSADVVGAGLNITFNGALDLGSVPAPDAFRVTVGGTPVGLEEPGGVTVHGSTVTLTLADPVIRADLVNVSYTQPSDSPLRDADNAMRPVAGFTQSVSNNTAADTTAPDIDTATRTVDGTVLTITFGDVLDPGHLPPGSRFAVTAGPSDTSTRDILGTGTVTVSGRTVRIMLATAVFRSDLSVKVAYDRPSTANEAQRLRNRSGGVLGSFSGKTVTNVTPLNSHVTGLAFVGAAPRDADRDGAGDTYRAGDVIEVAATFDRAVTVRQTGAGAPSLVLRVGAQDREAVYARGSGTAELVFAYTVAAGDTDADGVSVAAGSVERNDAHIENSGGQARRTHTGLAADAARKVDTVAPKVTGGAFVTTSGSATDGAFGLGDVIRVKAVFNKAVWVSGTLEIRLRIGNHNRQAAYVSGSGTSELLFDYAVQADDRGSFTKALNIRLNFGHTAVPLLTGGTIEGGAGLAAARVPADPNKQSIQAPNSMEVDGSLTGSDTFAPVLQSVAFAGAAPHDADEDGDADTYGPGDAIALTATFSEAVLVTGAPSLTVQVGANAREAVYASGGGTKALTFSYTVAAADADADGVSVAAGSIALNGGTLKDGAGNNAGLAHDAIAPDAARKVDGVLPPPADTEAPAFSSAARTGARSMVVTFDEALAPAPRLPNGAFAVTVDPGGSPQNNPVTGVSVDGNRVTLSTQHAMASSTWTYKVRYTKPAGAGTYNKLRDAAGNEVATFPDQTVSGLRRPPGGPAVTVAEGATADSLAVSWEAPSDTGSASINGYDVRWAEWANGGSGALLWRDGPSVAGTVMKTTIRGLKRATVYRVQVRAKSDDGDGDWSPGPNGAEGSTWPAPPRVEWAAFTSTPRRDMDGDGIKETYGQGEDIEVTVAFTGDVIWTDDATDKSYLVVRVIVGGQVELAHLVRDGATDNADAPTRQLRFHRRVNQMIADRGDADGVEAALDNGNIFFDRSRGSATVKDAYRDQPANGEMHPSRSVLRPNPGHKVASGSGTGNPQAPVATGSAIAGNTITLTFDKALRKPTARQKADLNFAFSVKGALGQVADPNAARSPKEVRVNGTSVTLDLGEPDVTAAPETIQVFYQPDSGNLILRSTDGNSVAPFDLYLGSGAGGQQDTDTTPPRLVRAAVWATGADADETVLRLTFDEPLKGDSIPAAAAFRVIASNPISSLPGRAKADTLEGTGAVQIAGRDVTVTLAGGVAQDDSVSVFYDNQPDPNEPPLGPWLRDAADNNVAVLYQQRAVVVDATPPTLVDGSVNGDKITLYYDEALDTGSVPAARDFEVVVGTVVQTVSGIEVESAEAGGTAYEKGYNGKVVLTLAAAPGGGVAVSYTAGANPIRDPAGNAAANFHRQGVGAGAVTGAPALVAGTGAVAADAALVTLTFTQHLDPASVPPRTAFEFYHTGDDNTLNGDPHHGKAPFAVDAVSIEGRRVLLRLNGPPPKCLEGFRLVYDKPASNPLKRSGADADAAVAGIGLPGREGTNRNYAGDEDCGLVTVSGDGNLQGNSANFPVNGASGSSEAPGRSFRARATAQDGSPRDIRGTGMARLSGGTVTVTLAEAVAPREKVTLSYAQASGAAPLRDADGRKLAEFSGLPLENAEAEAGAPAATAVELTSEAGADGAYAIGETIRATLTFDAAVEVTGAPRLRLGLGPADGDGRWGVYESGGGTADIAFAYTVAEGDASGDGVAVLADTLELDGGTIAAADGGANAALGHGGLSPNPDHRVDGVRPRVAGAAIDGKELTITFDEELAPAKESPERTSLLYRFFVKGTIDGVEQSPSAVAVDGRTVTLGLGTAAEAGQTITVSYDPPRGSGDGLRDAAGNAAAAFTDQPVANGEPVDAPANRPATGAPAIEGTAQVGETLTASTDGIADADGLADAAFAYQWLTDDGSAEAAIAGATGESLVVGEAQAGRAVKVRVVFTDDAGNAETLTSAATAPVAPRSNRPATGAPAIEGTAQVGETLTVSTSEIADADGLDGAAFAYQWLAGDAEVAGATGGSLVLGDAQQGAAVKVRVTFNDDAGNAETLTSAATEPVAARPNRSATGAPTIGGTPRVGETLTASTSEIADADGLADAVFAYQWLAGDAAIAGATGGSLVLAEAQAGLAVAVRVGFTDDAGHAESLTSAATGPVEARPNRPATGAPTITGRARVGETLTASTADIADADGLTGAAFAYQWLSNGAEIAGATGASLALADAQEGAAVAVRVAFTDDAGNAESLTSAATEAVAPPLPPLTASFVGVPAEHDGKSEFSFELQFSEDFPGRLPYKKLKEHALQATNGRVTGAARAAPNQNQRWTIRVRPWSPDDVTVSMSATTDCGAPGGICTPDGRPLSNASHATVIGPVGISVADARVEEDEGAVLAFAVTLSRAATSAFTVDYATSDGSAQAGVDYTAASGTLSFQAGESSRTIEVAVLDDSHDEGEETLTLRLSNPSSGLLADGEATGTIENRDPLPRALLARFGRTAAVHVVEHVEERLEAPREPGIRGRFAGREVRRGMEREMALGFLNQLGASAGVSPLGGAAGASPFGGAGGVSGFGGAAGAVPLGGGRGPVAGSPGGGVGGMASLGIVGSGGGAPMGAASPLGATGGRPGAAGFGAPGPGGPGMSMGAAPGPADGMMNGGGLLQMGLGGGDLLTGSSFAMNRESRGGILSFWSRGARSHFAGREGTLGLNGDVRTTMFGADYAKGPIVAGLSLSHSRGLGEYAGVASGQVLSSVTGLYPWLGYKATDRITVWGVGGYGGGGLLLTPEGGPALESGLSMKMAAAGTRGELVTGGAGGFELAFKADALWVGTSIDGVDGPAGRLKATAAAVTRFRTGLEGSRAYTLAGRLSLKPSVEVGLRHDGGDAETGAGMDVGAGLVVSDSSTGLSVDVRVRTLLVHQDEGFRERGVAFSLSYNPTPSSPLGFAAKVAPSWGGQARSGAEALWGRETMAGMAQGGLAPGNALEAEFGYGLPVGARLVGTPRVGLRTSEHGRDYRFGYGLGALEAGSVRFELSVDAQRRESALQGGASNGLLGKASLGW